jgi:hypothetical protein
MSGDPFLDIRSVESVSSANSTDSIPSENWHSPSKLTRTTERFNLLQVLDSASILDPDSTVKMASSIVPALAPSFATLSQSVDKFTGGNAAR